MTRMLMMGVNGQCYRLENSLVLMIEKEKKHREALQLKGLQPVLLTPTSEPQWDTGMHTSKIRNSEWFLLVTRVVQWRPSCAASANKTATLAGSLALVVLQQGSHAFCTINK